MKIYNRFEQIFDLSLALGFFDGIHIGHSVVIKHAINYAKKHNKKSGVILFKNHPIEFFTGQKFKYILPYNEKIRILNQYGVDYVFALDFNDEIADMSARFYMENILLRYFNPCAITTGYNHHFGNGATGDGALIKEYAGDFGFEYFQIPQIVSGNSRISSSVIRNAVEGSNFELAKDLLGFGFYIKSPVVHGRKIGTTMGFPTANLIYPENIVSPDTGTFYVKVLFDGKIYDGILNYGLKPTLNKDDVPVPEVHILDFDKNIYGKVIKLVFIRKIRDEIKFNSLMELKEQIKKDEIFARKCAEILPKNYMRNNI